MGAMSVCLAEQPPVHRSVAVLRVLARILEGARLQFPLSPGIGVHVLDGQCYAQSDSPSECKPAADDYLECLHHTKEVLLLVILVYAIPHHLAFSDCASEGDKGRVHQESPAPGARGPEGG